LTDTQPFDLVRPVADIGGSLVGERGDRNSLDPGDAGGVGQEERLDPTPGDDPKLFRRFHEP
jgi:hypothetical protein